MRDMATIDEVMADNRRRAEGERQGDPVVTPNPDLKASELPLGKPVFAGWDHKLADPRFGMERSRRSSEDYYSQ